MIIIYIYDFCWFFPSWLAFSDHYKDWSQESGDPEQIKAALEEAKRAGADEAQSGGPWKMDGVCIVLMWVCLKM